MRATARLRFFNPEHAIVLNIEEEHLDYYADLAAIEAVFNQLLEQTSGTVFYCADDANATRICARASQADFVRIRREGDLSRRRLHCEGFHVGHFRVRAAASSWAKQSLNVSGPAQREQRARA